MCPDHGIPLTLRISKVAPSVNELFQQENDVSRRTDGKKSLINHIQTNKDLDTNPRGYLGDFVVDSLSGRNISLTFQRSAFVEELKNDQHC